MHVFLSNEGFFVLICWRIKYSIKVVVMGAGGLLISRFNLMLETQQHIIPPEDDVLQVEGVLDDAGGGDPDPQDVLLRGDVRGS